MPCAGDSIIPTPMHMQPIRLFLLLTLAGLAAVCARKQDDAKPIATPSLTLNRTEAAVGSPIEMKYRFAMAPDAPPLNDDYTVFVHVLDVDREQLFGDDHL